MEEVELDVAPPPEELPAPVGIRVGLVAAALDDGDVRLEDRARGILPEGEEPLGVAAQLVEEDPADTSRFPAMRQIEVLVAPLLEPGVVRAVVAIAHRLHTAHDADRVAVVEEGLLAEVGTHDELVEREGSYDSLWDSWHGDH